MQYTSISTGRTFVSWFVPHNLEHGKQSYLLRNIGRKSPEEKEKRPGIDGDAEKKGSKWNGRIMRSDDPPANPT